MDDRSYIPPGQDPRAYSAYRGGPPQDTRTGRPIDGMDAPFGYNIHEDGTASPAGVQDAIIRGHAQPPPGFPSPMAPRLSPMARRTLVVPTSIKDNFEKQRAAAIKYKKQQQAQRYVETQACEDLGKSTAKRIEIYEQIPGQQRHFLGIPYGPYDQFKYKLIGHGWLIGRLTWESSASIPREGIERTNHQARTVIVDHHTDSKLPLVMCVGGRLQENHGKIDGYARQYNERLVSNWLAVQKSIQQTIINHRS